jgi:C4-dicarboxylate-specific signal transduction histidine kinase
MGDQERMKQVAINLIQNSLSKMYNGSITLDIKYNY